MFLEVMKTLLKSLVLPHLDYCSQLWFPCLSGPEILKLEEIQKTFTKRVKGYYGLPYWTRIMNLGLRSVERRMERYRCIYIHKILIQDIPNCGIKTDVRNERIGRTLVVPPVKGGYKAVQTLKDRSFGVEGPRLYNSLPRCLRNFAGTKDRFKVLLDLFLRDVPDQPNRPYDYAGAQKKEGMPSNLICDWTRKLSSIDWTPEEGRFTFSGKDCYGVTYQNDGF